MDLTRTAAYALTIFAVCLLGFSGPTQGSRASKEDQHRAPLGPGSLAAKASDRSGAASDPNRIFHSAASTEAELTIRAWLDSIAEHPENLENPPLEACAALSPRAAENFLRDPEHGWSPFLDVSRYAYLTHWEALQPFHAALLTRWAESAPASALAKLPPPDDREKALQAAKPLYDRLAEIDAGTAARLLEKWTEKDAANSTASYQAAIEKLMQAWTTANPDGAWQWIKSTDPDRTGWKEAAKGYVLGLHDPDWPAVIARAAEIPGGTGPQVAVGQQAIQVWGLEDPIAALTAFGAGPPILNPDQTGIRAESMFAYWLEVDTPASIPAGFIAEWLAKKPETKARLEAWQPAWVDRDQVFSIIARDMGKSEEVRTAARSLIHDPAVLATLDAARKFQLQPPYVSFNTDCGLILNIDDEGAVKAVEAREPAE